MPIAPILQTTARFNDEKNWVLRGVLSHWAQKRLEGAADGIIEGPYPKE